MWTGFKRIARAGFVGFWRNTFVSIAAIFVMTVALFVFGVSMMIDTLLGVSLEQIQNRVDINVYFVTSAPESEILHLQSLLEGLPEVAEVTYISREKALEQFVEANRNDEIMMRSLEEIGDNPFGASLSIRARETSQYEGVNTFLTDRQAAEDPQNPLIEDVNFLKNKDAIDRLSAIISGVERFTLAAMIVLVLASIIIVFNTIRLVIYTTRDEISVMRLVGASNSFIRGPFMLQGVMYGAVAGLLALLLLYPAMISVGQQTEQFFQFNIFEYFIDNLSRISLTIIGTGIVLGVLSSALAVARYLRV